MVGQQQPEVGAYAVLCSRLEGHWDLDVLPESLTEDLDDLIAAVQQQPGGQGAFALVDVADEFFVVVRVQYGRVRLLLSDVTAAVDWDLAGQVLDHLGLEVPADEQVEEILPAGDLAVLEDHGLDATELAAILSDDEAYADEMLARVAQRLGFAEAYERVVEALGD